MSASVCLRRRERGERSRLSADVKFPSSDLADNLNNFKHVSLGNRWFTEQTGSTGASLLAGRGPQAAAEIQFLSCMGGLGSDWDQVRSRDCLEERWPEVRLSLQSDHDSVVQCADTEL